MSSYEWASVIVAIVAAIIAAVSTVVAIASFIRAGKAVKAAEEANIIAAKANGIAVDAIQAGNDQTVQKFAVGIVRSGKIMIRNNSAEKVAFLNIQVFNGKDIIGKNEVTDFDVKEVVSVDISEAFNKFKSTVFEADKIIDKTDDIARGAHIAHTRKRFKVVVTLTWETIYGKKKNKYVEVYCEAAACNGEFIFYPHTINATI